MKEALIVVDLQVDLCRDSRRAHLIKEILTPLRRLVAAFVKAERPVLYSAFSLDPNDDQFRRFGDRYCVSGTPGAEIISELLPLQGPLILKKKHSAFFETQLDDHLRRRDVSTVYLAGLQTQICIMTTAADASFRGYRAVAIEDCVVSTDPKKKREALAWIGKYVGEVLTSSRVEEELSV